MRKLQKASSPPLGICAKHPHVKCHTRQANSDHRRRDGAECKKHDSVTHSTLNTVHTLTSHRKNSAPPSANRRMSQFIFIHQISMPNSPVCWAPQKEDHAAGADIFDVEVAEEKLPTDFVSKFVCIIGNNIPNLSGTFFSSVLRRTHVPHHHMPSICMQFCTVRCICAMSQYTRSRCQFVSNPLRVY